MAPHAWSSDDETRGYVQVDGRSSPNDYGFTPTPSDGSVNGDGNTAPSDVGKFVPVAICGMACRLPGGVNSPQDMWEFLINKKDARSKIPESRYNAEGWYSDKDKPGSVRTKHGYFLDNDPGTLDASFFSMTRNEIERCDPQQRQLLEVVREAVQDAGITGWRGSKTGVWVGSYGEDWCEVMDKDPQQYGVHRIVGEGDFALSNRVSYEMDLQGPSITIRSACAASLTCLHDACTAIANGDCSAAIIGGVSMILSSTMTSKLFEQGAVSPDASCKTFSADANGYARAEACNAVYIKPLADAIRDGNPVRAVIRATATNHDGKTPGITSPGGDTQEALVRHAYQMAGITDFSETAFAELHGTGTPAGDPIEAKAIGRVFGAQGIHIGSLKANFGHSEGASGLSSLIKSVLTLENRIIPPNIKFTKPSPKIPFEAMKLTVPVEPTAWPLGRKERVSLNSFGIGGSNVHVVLDSAASFNASAVLEDAGDAPQLLLYSANSADSLGKVVDSYTNYLKKYPERIEDLAYTLAAKREHLTHRTFVVASREKPGAPSPTTKAAQPCDIVMVFTGQGAQWPQMGRELMRSNAEFKARIKSLDAVLKSLGENGPKWTIEGELRKPAKTSQLHLAELSQPLCSAVQIALVDALAAVGVVPAAVVGHSSGEIAAAYAAGALTAEQAIIAAFHRGVVSKKQQRKGAMAAIGLGWDDVRPYLVDNVGVACENSPKSVTLSGDADKVEEVVAAIAKANPNVLARMLKVEKAYHSYHMAEIGEDYYQMVGPKMFGQPPTKPFFSSVTGKLLEDSTLLGSRYWQSNLENPVLFRSAVLSIMDHPISKNAMFLEVGPHPALAGPLRQITAERSVSTPYTSVLARGQNGAETFLGALGKLYTLNVPVDFTALYSSGTTLTGLPTYPWDHSVRLWHETRATKEWRLRPHCHHDLLGVKTVESTDYEPVWRNLLHLDNAPWLRDHQIGNDTIFPFAGYVAMAGEAISQITGVKEGFTIRNAAATTALVTPEGEPIELITTLRRHRLTTALDSEWWEFTVGSHNGHVWTKHCAGQIKAMAESIGPATEDAELPRNVDTRKWYQTVRQGGNMYGPRFQCLDNMKTSTMMPGRASAHVKNGVQGDEANYHIHPTILDSALQLLVTASALGLPSNFKNNVASSVAELTISRCYEDLKANVSAEFTGVNGVLGNGTYTSNGQVVMRMTDFASTILDNPGNGEMHAAARHVWRSDVDFQLTKDIFQPTIDYAPYNASLEQLLQACLLHTKRSMHEIKSIDPKMKSYGEWVQATETVELAEADDLCSARSIAGSLLETPVAAVSQAMLLLTESTRKVLSGEVQALDVLEQNEALNKFQTLIKEFDTSKFLTSFAHKKPNLRVLELGAGTGSATSSILKHLAGSYSKYVFSDFSSNLFNYVKEDFKDFRNMEFLPLNIGQDIAEQGFEGRQFDLIIANNVLDQMDDTTASLGNLRKLLDPQGRLLVQETAPTFDWVKYVLGANPGWWKLDGNGSATDPYLNSREWKECLRANELDVERECTNSVSSILLAKPQLAKKATKQVTLLCTNANSDCTQIERELFARGYTISRSTIDDLPPAGQDVISVLDADQPFLQNMTETSYDKFRKYLDNLVEAGVFWVTPLSGINVQDPRYSPILGFSRTVRNETGIAFATCQTDSSFADSKVLDVFEKFQVREADATFDPEMEYAVVNGEVKIGRFYPHSVVEELLISEPSDKAMLAIARPGRMDGLHWKYCEAQSPEADQVEVEVHSAGLSYRDVQIASGIDTSKPDFGLEAAGVVTQVGPNAKHIQLGDRVMVLANNALSTTITTPEALCVRLPADLSFGDAATMPLAYSLALYTLINVGQLQRGQTVLIHSAAGAVGLAAVQIAKMTGAVVYATVSNNEKAEFLVENFGLKRDQIFSSRDTSFANDIKIATGGNGVDLVLNSLSGELLHASWRCVAEFGKMVEIGKKDLTGAAKLDMDGFLRNRTYCYADLERVMAVKPLVLSRLLNSTMRLYNEGHIKPIPVSKSFNASEIYDAFWHLQQGVYSGKVVVELRDAAKKSLLSSNVMERQRVAKFDNSGSYLLVGGLGGLGRAVSIWMVEQGARNLIYLSRSAGNKPEDQQVVRELQSMGCNVELVKGSVTKSADVAAAVKAAGTSPLKGVIQMSMVLRDQLFANMSWEDWEAATAPKIEGTWNLHNATVEAGCTLDFFVCFSSITGVIGNKGQANYAAANTFLDAFCQYRTGLGLNATSIDLGVVEDVGVVSTSADLLNTFRAQGFWTLKEQQIIDALVLATGPASPKASRTDGAFAHPSTFVLGLASTVPLSSDKNRAVWRRDPRMAVYHNSGSEASTGASSSDDFKMFLASAKADGSVLKTVEAEQMLALEIGKRLCGLLMTSDEDVDISLGLADLGMDSLIAIDMRQWWKQTFGFDISVLEMLGMGTLEVLGKHAAKGLSKNLHGE